MELQGIVTNGVIVFDKPCPLPEGTRVRFTPVEDIEEELDGMLDQMLPDPSLPPDHPHAPYNREVELAILRQSTAEMNAEAGRSIEEAMEEIRRELGLLAK